LKFDTLKGWVRVHPDTELGCNTIKGHEVINEKLHQYVVTPTGLTANGKELKIGRRQGNY